jgi:hypothetical protein
MTKFDATLCPSSVGCKDVDQALVEFVDVSAEASDTARRACMMGCAGA